MLPTNLLVLAGTHGGPHKLKKFTMKTTCMTFGVVRKQHLQYIQHQLLHTHIPCGSLCMFYYISLGFSQLCLPCHYFPPAASLQRNWFFNTQPCFRMKGIVMNMRCDFKVCFLPQRQQQQSVRGREPWISGWLARQSLRGLWKPPRYGAT